ncbi:YopX protein [compost metagenome]
MQFTGEKDICSADIFKGDILQCENDKIYLVDFRKGSWVIVHAPTCGREREGECKTDYLHDALKALELEVIGNEYQTPELLTN